MEKKKKLEKNKAHNVYFKAEPIWIRMSIIGKYKGIKYRFEYKEYNNDDADEVIKKFTFSWPGRIPADKDFAEKGIKELFMKKLEGESFSYKVLKDDAENISDKAEEEEMFKELDSENYDHDL